MVKECGVIEVSSNELTAAAQTYPIECVKDSEFPMGRKVRVRLENTNNPLEIAEISVQTDSSMS